LVFLLLFRFLVSYFIHFLLCSCDVPVIGHYGCCVSTLEIRNYNFTIVIIDIIFCVVVSVTKFVLKYQFELPLIRKI
jgi:hypothetical protein